MDKPPIWSTADHLGSGLAKFGTVQWRLCRGLALAHDLRMTFRLRAR